MFHYAYPIWNGVAMMDKKSKEDCYGSSLKDQEDKYVLCRTYNWCFVLKMVSIGCETYKSH